MDSLIIFGAKYLFLAVGLLYLIALVQAGKNHRKQLFLSLIIAGVVAIILDKIAGKLYYDPRPFTTHHFKSLVAHAADNGFPSEHTVLAMTLSAALIYYRRRLGALSFGLALLVGISRVAAHIHSPIDIIGGIIIGAAAGSAGYWLSQKILNSR